MTQETEREAYRIEGNTIHKNPVDLGGGKWGVGFPICTVSEYADVETVKAIFEENEARASVGRGEVDRETADWCIHLSTQAKPVEVGVLEELLMDKYLNAPSDRKAFGVIQYMVQAILERFNVKEK